MSKRLLLCNTFGTLGYMSTTLQWAWLLVVSLPLFTQSKIAELILPSQQPTPIQPVTLQGPSQLWVFVGLVVSIVVIVATFFVLLRLPVSVAKTGKKISDKSAAAVIPVVTRHKSITKKAKKKLSLRLVKLFKLALIIAPLGLLLLTYFIQTTLAHDIVLFVGAFLTIGSLLWFSLQYIVARLLDVAPQLLV